MRRGRGLAACFLLAVSVLTAACAVVSAPPTFTEEERCRRSGGSWRSGPGVCGGGGGP